jgi:hypothetical protein
MSNENQLSFSKTVSLQLKHLKGWLKPEPKDHLAVKIIKGFLKSIAMLLLLLVSPVLLVGFALIFIGLM